nr:MAG TPA: hypothetical protein [Caudoviricetes sp.]
MISNKGMPAVQPQAFLIGKCPPRVESGLKYWRNRRVCEVLSCAADCRRRQTVSPDITTSTGGESWN